MTILGNLFLAVTTFFFLYFLAFFYGPKPNTTGEAAVGLFWGIAILHLIFLGGLTATAFAIGWNGGFDWLSPSRGTQVLVVLGGLVAILLTSGLAALFRYEGGPVPFPFSFKPFSLLLPALLPLVVLVVSAILLNDGLREAAPLVVVKAALAGAVGISAIGILGAVAGWLSLEAENAARVVERDQQDRERWNNNHLESIAATDSSSFSVAHILVFTSANHDATVRQKALEKVKSNPEWQQHLIGLIDQRAAVEVFWFLAYNDVDKALFAEPVNRAAFQVAEHFRDQIRRAWHPSHFYPDQFSYDTERVLLTLEKFKDTGVDYRPAVRAIRAALDEPHEHRSSGFHFHAEKMLDRWLKAN